MGQRADSGRNPSLDDKTEREAGARGEVKPQILKEQQRDHGGAFGTADTGGTDKANNLSEGAGGGGGGPAPAKD